MIEYLVYSGEYPFKEYLGSFFWAADDPAGALQRALKDFDGHIVVEPNV